MTIPWGTPPEPPRYEPPAGYKLTKIRPFYRHSVFWVTVVAVAIIAAMAVAMGNPNGSDTAGPAPSASSATLSISPSTASSTSRAPSPAPVAATTPEITDPPATTGALGKPVTIDWSGDGTGTVTVYSVKWVQPDPDSFVKPDNGAYLVIDVGYVGATGTVSYNPLYWSLHDADGREYDASLIPPDGYSPQLQSGDLTPGAKARGYVVFDVPQLGFTLELGDVFSGALMSWDMPAA